jgi:O-antigen/teichoic acid export membrane protein
MISGLIEPCDPRGLELGPSLRDQTPSLTTNFSWTAAGYVVYAAGQWGTLVVIAKLGDPGQLGQFALALAITAPLTLFANMQLSSVQATDARHLYTFPDYLAVRLVSVAIAALLSAIVAVTLVSSRSTAIVIVVVALTKAADSVSDIFFGHLQQAERMRRVGLGLMLNGVLTLTAVTIAMLATRNVIWAAVGSLAASFTALAAYNSRIASPVRLGTPVRPSESIAPHWDRRNMWRLTRIALPLGVAGMCVSVYGNMPRYFVQHYYGDRALGYFAAIAYAMTAGSMVINALGQAAVPRLARHWSSGNQPQFWRLLLQLVGILLGSLGIVIAFIAGGPLLKTFYQPEYSAYRDLLIWIMAAAAVGYVGSGLGYGINATRAFDRLALPYCGVAAAAVLVCWWLVPAYGLIGAAWATGVTSLFAATVPVFTFMSLNRNPT